MIYDPSVVLPLPVAEPFDLMPPAQAFERDEAMAKLNGLLDDAPSLSDKLPGNLTGLSDASLSRLFGADIAPPLAPLVLPAPAQDDANVKFDPSAFDALQRRVRPGLNELSRYGYDAGFRDPYGADLRNELRTLVRNTSIQGL